MPTHTLSLTPIPARKDNYIWLFPTGPGRVAAVDPGESDPVLNYLSSQELDLSHILITHHHYDHVEGIEPLRHRFRCPIIGSHLDRHRLPALDIAVQEGDQLTIGNHVAKVMHLPGHTTGHIVYLIDDVLFCGDVLFGYGSGRIFEGTPEQMWSSLQRIRALPEAIRTCSAHEYTVDNLRFALSLEPDTPELNTLFEDACAQIDRDQPTLPNSVGREKRFNPFLRCDDPVFAARIGCAGQAPADVLATIRERRNRF
ncbi:MAG: hydroxyacylglutathione hydrolase [Magnetococcales bacterium]|nr:hydroxyacylglutathione hydrolase [Magnetococcales bacterium]